VSAGGRELDGVDALYAVLDELPTAGGSLSLTLLRGIDERDVEVVFESSEAAA
jgi:hypothetical protein